MFTESDVLTGSRTVGARAGRLLLRALTTPHGPDRFLEHVAPLAAVDEVRAQVVGVDRSVPGAAVVRLRPSSTWRGGRPGQFVRLGVEVDGRRRTRCFSLSATTPHDDGLVVLGVRQTPDGVVSRWLVEDAQPGDVLAVSQAQGDVGLDDEPPPGERLLTVTGGSGVTPVLSLLAALAARQPHAPPPVDVLHFERTRDRLIGGPALADLARAAGVVTPRVLETRGSGPGSGRFAPARVADVDPARTRVFVCGPSELAGAVEDWWTSVDGDPARLRLEHYAPGVSVAAPPPAGSTGGQLRFTGSDVEVVDDGRTLLEQAESAGLSPDFGCRQGVCRTCVSPLVGGAVRDLVTGDVTDDPDTTVALCTSVPAGDAAVAV